MTNETLETIKNRRSCRAYKPEQITDEELNAVLEAGTYAASAMGRQSAKIVVVQDAATRAQLTRMNAAVMGKDTDPMYGAPTILVVLADAHGNCAVQDGSLVMGWGWAAAGSTVPGRSSTPPRARLCSKSGASRVTGSASATAFLVIPLRSPSLLRPASPIIS